MITIKRNSLKKPSILLPLLIVSFIGFAKEKVKKIELEKKNSIEYTFNISKDSLYNAMVKHLKITNMMLWDIANKDIMPTNISSLFLQSDNKFDFYLEPVYYICKSRIYFKENGDSLEYLASFYIHLQKIDKLHTKVIIKTLEPKIIVGQELFPTPPHFVRKDKTIAVEPSTIEEYKILLEIGKLVGEKDMPPLNLPEKK